MMPWALGSRLQRRKILACSILLAVLACMVLPGVSDASRKLRGADFVTKVPSTWKTGKGKQGTTRVYGAASPGTKRNVAANSMQLGISVVPVVDMERQLGRKLPPTLEELLALLLQGQAQNAQVTAPLRSSALGGRPAASGALQFSPDGATTVLLSETVSVYRGRIYVVAYTVDVGLQYKGLAILRSIHRHWRWR